LLLLAVAPKKSKVEFFLHGEKEESSYISLYKFVTRQNYASITTLCIRPSLMTELLIFLKRSYNASTSLTVTAAIVKASETFYTTPPNMCASN
jgi:hypothetical protein